MTKTKAVGASYVNDCRRAYSDYVMRQRAVPAMTDGMIHAARRILWTARSGAKYKCATLAGATMPIHPHASPEGTVDSLAMPYANNIPLLTGIGGFGTLLQPTACGASRYTSVYASTFTHEVIYTDMDLIPMQDNYDGTEREPVHFLPLIPLFLLNPHQGIVIGYKSTILPRPLDALIDAQLAHLQHAKTFPVPLPALVPIGSYSVADPEDPNAFTFTGSMTQLSANRFKITSLPYDVLHQHVIDVLTDLEESGTVTSFRDHSANKIDIEVSFKPGAVKDLSHATKLVGLIAKRRELMTILDITGQSIYTGNVEQSIRTFTEWRVEWYLLRYQHLKQQLATEIQRYVDIKIAIDNDAGKVARTTKSKKQFVEFLLTIGVVDTDYVSDMPVYRFTQEEYAKNQQKLAQAEKQMAEYDELIASPDKRRKVYIAELKAIKKRYIDGAYS